MREKTYERRRVNIVACQSGSGRGTVKVEDPETLVEAGSRSRWEPAHTGPPPYKAKVPQLFSCVTVFCSVRKAKFEPTNCSALPGAVTKTE